MTTSGESSIIDIVMGQPAIYWSLVISLAILLLALGLWMIFYLRNRLIAKKAEKLEQAKNAKDIDQLGTQGDQNLPSQLSQPEVETSQSQGQLKESDANSNGSQPSKEEQSTSVKEDDESEGNSDSVKIEAAKAGEEEPTNSHLASIFEETVRVDPQLQAMIDELPEIPISDLVEKINDVASELKKRNAMRYPG